jgi:hypothetical protein
MGRFIIENNRLIGYDNDGLKSVDRMEVPEGVTHIDCGGVFSNIKEVKTLILPKSLRSMRLLGYYDRVEFDEVIFKDPKGWARVGYTDWAGQRMEERVSESVMADSKECRKYMRFKGSSCGSYDDLEKM